MADVVDLNSHRKTFSKQKAATPSADCVVVWEEKIAQVRELELKIQVTEGKTCLLAMDFGDVLTPIRKIIGYGKWERFLRACGVPVRRASSRLHAPKSRRRMRNAFRI
jgi:hypothetical protein